MRHQPLLLDRSFPAQFFLAIVLPVAFGLLTGYVLGVDETGYLILSVLGIGGGIAAGYDHLGADEGFVRGIIGGLLFGVAILVGHSVFGQEAKAKIPNPHVVLPIITTILGALFGAWGGALRARHTARASGATRTA
jgi:ABC-type antimicrobial peptide transport system permease subunit